MTDRDNRQAAVALPLAIGVLLVLAVGIVLFGGALVPTLGIAAVGAGLFLPPLRTVLVAVFAVALAAILVPTQNIENPGYRIGNVALASALAVLASWTIEQRMASIRALNRTQSSVLASVPDGLAVIDAQGVVLQCNEALTRLVTQAAVGQRLHPLLGHVLADGSLCAGGCQLDSPHTGTEALIQGESITGLDAQIAVEYTTAPIDDQRYVVSLRDVTALKDAELNRRLLLEAAVRQGEQEQLLKALGAPEFAHLPQLAGVRVDLYSTPTAAGSPTGGDLVNVAPLPDGRILIMIADALGDGVLSVRDASKVLYTARAYVEAGIRLEDVVGRTARTMATEAEVPDVSLMLAVLDTMSGRIDLAGGGHPPALLIRENGATEWLEGTGPGIGEQQSEPSAAITRQLTPADSLVFYTDGVVDGAQDVFEGLSTLRASATALRKRSVEGWAKTVTDAVMVPGQNSGNATVLLVRLDPDAGRQTTATR